MICVELWFGGLLARRCGESCAICSHPVRDRYKCTLAKNCSMETLPCPGAVVTYLGLPV